MEWIDLSWEDVVNRYDDDQQSFEQYFCDQLGIDLAEYEKLEAIYASKSFKVRPNYDYIRWRGIINSDFTLVLKED